MSSARASLWTTLFALIRKELLQAFRDPKMMAVVLGIMILVHEFGHFALAKLLGVRVEQFALGFGKRVAGFRRGRRGGHEPEPAGRGAAT